MSKVIWKVDNTINDSMGSRGCIGLYSDKQQAIHAALNIYGRRGLTIPFLVDEHITRPIGKYDTSASLKVSIQSNDVVLEVCKIGAYKTMNILYSHIARDMVLCSSPDLDYFKRLATKRSGDREFYISVTGINDDLVNDYIDELRASLISMRYKEPREIFMQCMELRCQ